MATISSSLLPKKTFIGLSVGNHNSVIAIINKEHRAEVIANEDGEHKTPTYIAFSGEEEYHGSQAKHQFVRNAQNTILGFRDLVGKPYSDELKGRFASSARVEASGAKPVFVVTTENEDGESKELRLTAEEVLERYLGRLKTTAEEYLGRKIDGAVVAHPVGFSDEQKTAFRAACEAAGLPLLQLIPEPVACGLQYGLGSNASHDDAKDTVALVVDVGGTGAAVSVLAVHGGLFTLVDSLHTSEISGEIVDEVLVRHFAGEFKKQSGVDVLEQGNSRAVRKLRQAVEVTKRTLSSAATAPCAVESLANGMDFSSTVNRTRFDIMANKTYTPLLDSISTVLARSGYTPGQVDQVLLCGGAARVRKLQARVAAMFPESTQMRDGGELDEVIAAGCAEQAALIAQGTVEAPVADAAIQATVLARPVGIQVSAERLVAVLQKDTPLPASRTIKVALPAGEKRAYVAVSEGEPAAPPAEDEDEDEDEDEAEGQTEEAKEPIVYRPSKLLAEMVLELDQADEFTRINVTFFVGTDSKLTVTATEPVSGKSITAEIPQ